MIKQLFIILNIISIFIYQLFIIDEPNVRQSISPTISPNGETTVTITITKNNLEGFAKLQQSIPNGFAIKNIDGNGATFSFKNQILKYIWLTLPSEEVFTITYTLINVSHKSGTFSYGGQFSYLNNSERINIDIPPSSFIVTENIALLSTYVPENDTLETEKAPPITNAIKAMNVTRSIEKIDDLQFKVELHIFNQHIDGFVKITEKIPVEFSAKQDISKTSIFSFEEKQVKFMWLTFPLDEDKVTVSYIITADSADGVKTIKGNFSYIDDGDTKEAEIQPTQIEIKLSSKKDASLLTLNATNQKKDNAIITTSEIEEKNNENQFYNKETTAKKSENTSLNKYNPEKGITYKVQVGAFRTSITINRFKKKLNLSKTIELENHEGWTKLITGNFDKYAIARDERNTLRNSSVKSAFITAYNNGTRITVQEALMISNQKWVF